MTRLYVTLGGTAEVAAGTEIFQMIEILGACRNKNHGDQEKQRPWARFNSPALRKPSACISPVQFAPPLASQRLDTITDFQS